MSFSTIHPDAEFPCMFDEVMSAAFAMQFQLEKTQWLGRDEIEQHQLMQLERVVSHAQQFSPYYRRTLPATNRADDLQGMLRQLPILGRQAVREFNDEIHAPSSNPLHQHVRTGLTSGSTGTAVAVRKSQFNNVLWRAFGLREHYWHQRDFKGNLCAIRWTDKDTARPPEGLVNPQWGTITEGVVETGKCYFLNINSSVKEQAKWLDQRKPAYLLSFPSNLKELALYYLRRGIGLEGLREVRTVGETVTDELRSLVSKAWGVKIVDCYTSEEFGYIALQCPDHDVYHVQSENVIVEILDDNNEPCGPGEQGRVVVTSLNHFATPLIRYEIGDHAEWGEPCSCGRGLPVIKRLLGRSRNRLKLPNGSSIFPYFGDHSQLMAIVDKPPRQFQIIQKSLMSLELVFAVDTPYNKEQEMLLRKLIIQNLGSDDYVVSFRYVNEIAKGSRGKFEEFISLVE